MLTWNRTVQPSMAQQYNLTVQQEVAKDTTFQIGYVGQHATHMVVPEQLQQGVLQSDGTVLPSPFLGGQNPPGVNGSTKASPTYGPNGFGVVKLTASVGSMKYNALQTVLQKRFSHGLGNNLPAIANAVVGNWSINPIVTVKTGFPLALSGTDNSGTGSAGPRPNCNDALLTYPKTTTPAGLLWFNPDFVTTKPPAGTFGNCPAQGPIIGPGYSNVDVGLQKNFLFTETKRLQFRADFLNAFNHPNFAHPNIGTGIVSATQDARQIQMGLKFYF